MKKSFKILVLVMVLIATSFSFIGCACTHEVRDQDNTISVIDVYQEFDGNIIMI